MNADDAMADAVRIRPYEDRDREGCLAVFDSNVPRFFAEAERPEFADFLDRLPGPYLVLEASDGRILGCGGYALDEGSPTADLCWGMVEAARHGTGLGRRLTEARIADLRAARAVRSVRIRTSQHTRGFYERLGFRLEGHEADGHAPGIDLCEMRFEWTG